MKEIKLNGKHGTDATGAVAKVDDCFYDELVKYNWFVQLSGPRKYACRQQTVNGKQKPVMMHRQILGLVERHIYADHINHDTLDNRVDNIRIANSSQNGANSIGKRKIGFKGVCKRIVKGKYVYWDARCIKDRKAYFKHCRTEIEAAKAYNEMAIKLHGEFAYLNAV
jgi:hypothetical protein